MKKGISLIVLVITIIVIIILAGAVILNLTKNNPMDSAKKAKFMANFTNVEEAVGVYSMSKLSADNSEYQQPISDKLSLAEKQDIKTNVPTLAAKIIELNPGKTIDDIDLYHIDPTLIGAENLYKSKEKGYLIDISTRQIYDYSGEYFEEARWHTLDSGVKDGTLPEIVDDIVDTWDGWIKLTLFYPSNSTERKWRLGESGEIRTATYNNWQDYTGPITVRLSDVENIWISYVVDNKTVVIPPLGKVVVDIRPDGNLSSTVTSVKVNIIYDENATVKEYKVGDGNWQTYIGEFTVTEPSLIQARATKPDNVYDTNGNLLQTRNAVGTDAYYIRKVTSSGGSGGGTGGGSDETGGGGYPNSGDPSTGGTNLLCGDLVPDLPTITWTPTSNASSVTVSVAAPETADRIYVKLGDGSYVRYTAPITVTSNTYVRAYYITYDGETSCVRTSRVNNIQGTTVEGKTLPYVSIALNPTSYEKRYTDKVIVTINSSDATSVEYSTNGVEYTAYTGAFEVTKNGTIYARATNANGVATDIEYITNIGKKDSPPVSPKSLAVNITVNPEPAVTVTQVAKATVSIEYDSKATRKYYKIGVNGTLQTYIAPFEVTSNCTIYAYAVNDTSTGDTYKVVDNIVDGIANPLIYGNPTNGIQATKTKISIEYDKNATVKQYKINNNGQLRDYTGAFEVTGNATIYAYAKNVKGQSAESSYTITNITAPPPVLTIDYGKYFLLKLNYPEQSTTREYKWKESGDWKNYNEQGILLIKPEYKDEILNASGNVIIKIKDENGVEKTYTGDYYILDVAPSEIFENIFMRWDRVTPSAPLVVLNTEDPAREVTATIQYESSLVKKQYKVVDPDGTVSQDWTDYSTPIKVTKNNTIIYARGQDDAEVWSSQAVKKVTNIDEMPPEIKLTADLEKVAQSVQVKVAVTDDVKVAKVKWTSGQQGENFFKTGGTEINNNSVVKITANGYYTFYAEDGVGNAQVYTLYVPNIDLTPPALNIQVTPETTVGTSVKITIDYGDSTTKQYKIGESNTTLTNYTGEITLTSYTVLANNWKNADGTVTVYAKGKDSVGNEKNESKKILNLDVDAPKTPVISSNSGYGVLTSYGVTLDATTTITYDTRTDIDNYYSIDSGVTWLKYIGSFQCSSGTVIAKSIKKDTGLEISVSKTITMPADALKSAAYDGSDTTYSSATVQYIKVDNTMEGKNIRVLWSTSWKRDTGSAPTTYYYPSKINFLDENKTVISTVSSDNTTSNINKIYSIPVNTAWIRIDTVSVTANSSTPTVSMGKIYEMQVSNEPTFSVTNEYMLLHADPTKAIKTPYQMISIAYFPTDTQRLYRIGTTGDWLNYQDKAIWVNQGETLYAKGVDKNGTETRVISSTTVNVTNALKKEAFDGSSTTYSSTTTQYMRLDSSMEGKNINVIWTTSWTRDTGSAPTTYYYPSKINFLDEDQTIISTITSDKTTSTINKIFAVPINTRWIRIDIVSVTANSSTPTASMGKVYEIQASNNPLITATPTTPTNGNVTISISKLLPTYTTKYSFDGTNWQTYTTPLIITANTTVYSKAILPTGTESSLVSLTIANIDKVAPTVKFGTNGSASTKTASTTVTITDTGTSGVDTTTLQYVWDKQNVDEPSSEWTTFTNGATITKGSVDDIYYLWIKGKDKAGNSVISCSNSFGIDNTSPDSPTISATPTILTNGNVTVTIAYPSDASTKQYSTNGTTWSNYTAALTITSNLTVYAKSIDVAGNQSGATTLTIVNIDKTTPTVVFGTNGQSNVNKASTTVTLSDALSGLNESSLQYVWSTSTTAPTSGWISFNNGDTLEKSEVTGTYYLWIKASDNVGNILTTKTNAFVIDNTAPTTPTIAAVYNPSLMTSATITITYPSDASKKEYSFDNLTWQTYTAVLSLTGDCRIYAKATDATGNVSDISIREIYIPGKIGYIPAMTSSTTPSPFTITSSSTLAAGYENWRAFDGTLSGYGWATVNNDIADGNSWIQITLDKEIKISKYYIIARNDGYVEQTPKDFKLQGCNDGVNWDTIDTRAGEANWKAGELRWYTVNSNSTYKYYRLYVTANNVSTYVTIDEMNIYE